MSRIHPLLSLTLVFMLIFTSCGWPFARSKSDNVISEKYAYDEAGRLDYKILPNGEKIKFTYDTKGQLTGIAAPGLQAKLAYDERGNIISAQDNNGKTEYRYDEFNRPIEVVYRYDVDKKIGYEYDPWNRVTGIKVLNKNNEQEYQVNYAYDLFGNLLAVDEGNTRIAYVYYPEKGEAVRLLPNGVKSTFTFLPGGELSSITHLDKTGNKLASYNYQYDAAGRIIRVQEQTPQGNETTRYEWGNRGYLSDLNLPDGKTISYQYDAMGNRLAVITAAGKTDYQYDGFSRLIKSGNSLFEYDNSGNVKSIKGNEQHLNLEYNIANQPTKIQAPKANVQMEYKYDGSGNLIWSKDNKNETYYLPQPLAPPGFTLAEYSGDTQRYYTYGKSLLSSRDTKNGVTYFLEDGFNSLRLTIDREGKIIGRHDYSPFGELTRTQGQIPGNFRTGGEKFLPEVGLYLVGYRPYHPQSACYLTPDLVPQELSKFEAFSIGARPEPFYAGEKYSAGFAVFEKLMLKSGYYDWDPKAVERYFMWQGAKNLAPSLPISLAIEFADIFSGGQEPKKMRYTIELAPGFSVDEFIRRDQAMKRTIAQKNWWWSFYQTGKWLPQKEQLEISQKDKEKEKQTPELKLYTPEVPKKNKKIMDDFPFFPDDHGGGGAAIAISPKPKAPAPTPIPTMIHLPTSPLVPAATQLGGISLGATMELKGDVDLGNMTGVIWDDKKQCLVLLGDRNTALPSVKAADLAVALKCIFGSRQEPAFSLDPADPSNPRGPYLKPVYYGPIEGTHFGQVMFDADWKLKEYSFGIRLDKNGQKQEITSKVPGYKDTFTLSFEQPWKEGETYMRYWITCDDVPVYQKDGAMYFGPVKMKVNTEKMFLAEKGLTSSKGQQDPVGEAFAAHFTAHYDEFASEEPAFAEVKELTKAVALAKWLKEQKIPVDMGWVEKCMADARVETPKQVSVLNHTKSKEYRETSGTTTTIQTLTIYVHGGVDLAVNPRYQVPDKELTDLTSKVKEKIASNPIFEVAQGAKNLKAVVLPLTSEGKSRWGKGQGESVEQDGIKYSFSNQKVTEAVDAVGNTAKFSYAPDGQLREMTWTLIEGYQATAKRKDGRDTLEITTPDKNTVSYYYNASGELNAVNMNGKTYAHFSSTKNLLEVTYDKYVERFVSDDKGYITSYQAGRLDSPKDMRALSFAYDDKGNLTRVSGTETGEVRFSYTGDKLSTVQMPGDGISYTYDGQNRLRRVTSSSGKAVEYNYDGDKLTEIFLRNSGLSAKGVFENGRLVQMTDFFGAEMKYEYTPEGKLSRVIDPQGWQATYQYNEKGQLGEANLPDGSSVVYKYAPTERDQLVEVNVYQRKQ